MQYSLPNHLIILLCVFASIMGYAQSPTGNLSSLSIEQIMKGEQFVGSSPENISWSEDGQWIYFDWNPEQELISARYKVNIKGGTPEKMTDEELMKVIEVGGAYTKDRLQKAYEFYGDIYWADLKSGKSKAITYTTERESSPIFSEGGKFVIYQQGLNLFAWEVASGTTRQLTNFQRGTADSEPKLEPNDAWLKRDQLEHFEVLQERDRKQKAYEARRKSTSPKYPEPIHIGTKNLQAVRISPDMKYVVYQLVTPANATRTMVPDFVTASGHTEEIAARSKVGEEQDRYEMGIFNIEKDTTYRVDITGLEGIYDKPSYMKEYHADEGKSYHATYEAPREVIIHSPIFSEQGHAVVDIKAMDNKDRWIALLDLATGHLKLIDRQHDDAWIGGPGISGWNMVPGSMGWVDESTLWFQSEESGYSHLYTHNILSEETEAVTEGKFEVLEVQASHDGMFFYLTTNEGSPHEHHFYKVAITGGERTKITSRKGGHRVWISPDEQQLAILYSQSNKPWELFVMPNQPQASMKQLTISTRPEFERYQWRSPSIVTFKAADGAEVSARLYLPDNTTKKTPAVIFVHGAGYLQNVHHWWSSYYREYMFHNFLADNGYAVLDIDYRGSKGYGRDWRTGIYRHMGGKDLSDQVDGAKYLVEGLGINPNRIGIYGGSYGGFISIMAMFKASDTFKAGAALRSVTDWAHYNHPYTSNILNTPVLDSIAYKRSSPIYHAKGLKGKLLMLHGMLDDNVQFQDVVRLSQRLIELDKDHWELAVFPLERHGFVEPSSWREEYKRIYRLFETSLRGD